MGGEGRGGEGRESGRVGVVKEGGGVGGRGAPVLCVTLMYCCLFLLSAGGECRRTVSLCVQRGALTRFPLPREPSDAVSC